MPSRKSSAEIQEVVQKLIAEPETARKNIEQYIDTVNEKYSIPALQMLVAVTELHGSDSKFKIEELVASLLNGLTRGMSEVSDRKNKLAAALERYAVDVAAGGAKEAAEALSEQLTEYVRTAIRATGSSADLTAKYLTWLRHKARQYYRNSEVFKREHPQMATIMIQAGILLSFVENMIGIASIVSPYLLIAPTALEIGKKLGDIGVENLFAWIDAQDDEKVKKAIPGIVRGEAKSRLSTAWELINSFDNVVLGSGAVNDATNLVTTASKIGGGAAAVSGVGTTVAGGFFTAVGLGMAVSELYELKYKKEEPELTAKQKKEAEKLLNCASLAFKGTDEKKLRLQYVGGEFTITDPDTGRVVVANPDGTYRETSGTALLGLEWAKVRYGGYAPFVDPSTGDKYRANWEAAKPGPVPKNRSEGYSFDVFMVDDADIGYQGVVWLDEDGGIVDCSPGKTDEQPGFKAALDAAAENACAVSFKLQVSTKAKGPGPADHEKQARAYIGYKIDWPRAKYLRGAAFLGYFEAEVSVQVLEAKSEVKQLKITPDGYCDNTVNLLGYQGGAVVSAFSYAADCIDGLRRPDRTQELELEQLHTQITQETYRAEQEKSKRQQAESVRLKQMGEAEAAKRHWQLEKNKAEKNESLEKGRQRLKELKREEREKNINDTVANLPGGNSSLAKNFGKAVAYTDTGAKVADRLIRVFKG